MKAIDGVARSRPSGLSFISSSGTSSNANGWSANPTCAIVKLPASDRRFSTMPICSTQNLRQASASFTYSTTYPTFMCDPRNAAPCAALARDFQAYKRPPPTGLAQVSVRPLRVVVGELGAVPA